MKLVVVIPAYNEEETIATVVREIPREIEGIDCVEVLLVDDGSTDSTAQRAKEAGVDNILRHRANQGLAVTFKDGLDHALGMGAGIVVNLDADGQYDAGEIPKLIQPILEGRAEIVLGWRDLDSLDFMPRGNKIGNRIATWVTTRLSSLPIKDAQTGFRAFSDEAALRLNLTGKYTYVQETIIQAKYKGLRIEQVPVEFRPRVGKSRLISGLGSYALRAGAIMLRTYRDYEPLKAFSVIAGFFFLIGLAFGIRVLVHFAATGAVSPYLPSAILSSVSIIVGLGAIILGVFADMVRGQRLVLEGILYRLKKGESKKPSAADTDAE